jgi:hypothetical protein
MDSTARAVRRFERFLFLRPYEPLSLSEEDETIATIIYRPDQQTVEVVRNVGVSEVIRNEEVCHALRNT